MTREKGAGARWPVILLGGLAVAAATAAAIETVPELAPLRRYTHEASDFATHLPQHARELVQEVRSRWQRAAVAFQTTRLECERVLLAQFQEAKQRGAVPPV